MLSDINRQKDKIEYLFILAAEIEDEESKSHWCRYICVLLCGFIENSVKIMIRNYVKKLSHTTVSNYVGTSIKNITNINDEKLKQIVGSFHKEWREKLEEMLSDEHKEAFDSVYANRNRIAHGKDVTITYHRLKPYYNKIWQALSLIYDNFLKV